MRCWYDRVGRDRRTRGYPDSLDTRLAFLSSFCHCQSIVIVLDNEMLGHTHANASPNILRHRSPASCLSLYSPCHTIYRYTYIYLLYIYVSVEVIIVALITFDQPFRGHIVVQFIDSFHAIAAPSARYGYKYEKNGHW